MDKPVQLVGLLGALVLTGVIFDLIRRRRLKEELWFPWSAVAAVLLVVSVWPTPWVVLAHVLGIVYEPALLLIGGLFFCIFLILYMSVVISTLMRQMQDLARCAGELAWRLDHERDTSR